MADYRYVSLISSLPYHGDSLFAAKQTPLSRIRLLARLADLDPTDHALLMRIWRTVDWSQYRLEAQVPTLLQRVREVTAELENPRLRAIVEQRFEIRTLVAGLRRRRNGETSPPKDRVWGHGRWLERMTRYWNEPGFRLERVYPWVFEADRLLAQNDPLNLERLILSAAWTHLGQAAEDHYFDFEAVVVYVLRWDLIDRWTRYHGDRALHRFQGLVEQGLQGHEALFPHPIPERIG